MLTGKNILIGITGGIAAYKTAHLVREFIKEGANVKCIQTPSSKSFIIQRKTTSLQYMHLILLFKRIQILHLSKKFYFYSLKAIIF